MKERLPFYVIRAFFVLVCAGLGLYGSLDVFYIEGVSTSPNTLPYLLGACVVAVLVILAEMMSSHADISTLSCVIFGLVLGLVLSILFRPVIDLISESFVSVPEEQVDQRFLHFFQLVSAALFCYFGVTILLHTRGQFKFIVPYVEFRREIKDRQPLLLDTSVLIDGRIEAFLRSGVIHSPVMVPNFVLDELHALSDSSRKIKRERGRRGLKVLSSLQEDGKVEVLPVQAAEGEVDVALLGLATDHGGWILTTDANLVERGKVQGVNVVNLNEVADAMKLNVVPGEIVKTTIIRKGEEKHQGVGFLSDGTMLVVQNGEDKVGEEVTVEVTSMIRTSAGRMIFGDLVGEG